MKVQKLKLVNINKSQNKPLVIDELMSWMRVLYQTWSYHSKENRFISNIWAEALKDHETETIEAVRNMITRGEVKSFVHYPPMPQEFAYLCEKMAIQRHLGWDSIMS